MWSARHLWTKGFFFSLTCYYTSQEFANKGLTSRNLCVHHHIHPPVGWPYVNWTPVPSSLLSTALGKRGKTEAGQGLRTTLHHDKCLLEWGNLKCLLSTPFSIILMKQICTSWPDHRGSKTRWNLSEDLSDLKAYILCHCTLESKPTQRGLCCAHCINGWGTLYLFSPSELIVIILSCPQSIVFVPLEV